MTTVKCGYIEEIEEEKTRLTNNISLIAEKEKEHYSELMKEQLRLQEENLRKINNFRFRSFGL